jgi:hypothetical protein
MNATGGKMEQRIHTWNIIEFSLQSNQMYDNPYIDVEVSAIFKSPTGEEKKVLGFWDGNNIWKIRFAPPVVGQWEWHVESSVPEDAGLHGQKGTFETTPYSGDNPIYRHGFLKVNDNQRGFGHADGTPFFWLGDTAWSVAAGARLEEWQEYVNIRSTQGFNVVQVNSLHQHDSSVQENRQPFAVAGETWDTTRPNIDYFRTLDQIFATAVDAGMFIALVVLWFDYVPGTNLWWDLKRREFFPPELAARWGRYLTARYGAFGTVWLVTGDTDFEVPAAMAVYDAAAEAIRQNDPYSALMTAHINGDISTPVALNERDWLDFHMYQSGHSERSANRAIECATVARGVKPVRPVLNGEPMYDSRYFKGEVYSLKPANREKVREVYWKSIIGGGNAGLTYGAHGIWSWDRTPISPTWRDLLTWDSGQDIIRLKEYFSPLPWWELEPAQHLLDQMASTDTVVAEIPPQKAILVYTVQLSEVVLALQRNLSGEWFNPATGEKHAARVSTNDGKTFVEPAPWSGDAVLLLQ